MYLFISPVFSGYMSRSGVAGLDIFGFLRSVRPVLHKGCTRLHPHQECRRVLFSPHYYLQTLMLAILISVRWYLLVVWICLSLIISDIEHLFMCLLAICYVFSGEMSV